jgi:phosphoglycolate phosphatase-like HAD superfamily hydrolase
MFLLLFDIDGTLLLGQGVGRRSMERAGKTMFGDAFSLEHIDFGGALDPWIFAQAARLAGIDEPERHQEAFRAAYLVELRRALASKDTPGPRALPGVAHLIALLRRRADVTLGLVTGNYEQAAPLKIAAAGLDPSVFSLGAFGDHAPTRPELVALAVERWERDGAEVDPSRVVVIGDTPRDVHCARENGCRCLAVTTGYHDADALRAAGADVVAEDLSNPSVLLDMLG